MVPEQVCRNEYSDVQVKVTNANICVGLTGQYSCYGDSGGPAAANGKLIGVTSGGGPIGCDDDSHPTRYMKLAYYLGWINKYIPQNNNIYVK